MRRTRKKIDTQLTGYDIEVMLGAENHLIFNGKELENDRTISDYNIKEESTLRVVFGLEGGGVIKRHMQKPEALVELKTRAKTTLKTHIKSNLVKTKVNIENTEAEQEDPNHEDFINFLKKMRQAVDDLKVMRADGVDMISSKIRTLPSSFWRRSSRL